MKILLNMKFLLLTYQTHPLINIGDYIQSLAAKQYLPKWGDILLAERNELNTISLNEPSKIILNGWFTYKPENWPPHRNIQPLFVAFHLNETCRSNFFTPKAIEYMKQHEPIGCRDMNTVHVMKEHGIDAYFSGCLTLTLGETYHSKERGDDIYIVDPLSYLPDNNSIKQVILTLLYMIYYIRPVRMMFKKMKRDNPIRFGFSKVGIGQYLLWGRSYVYMRKCIDRSLLKKAHFITHIYDNKELPTDEERFRRAEELIKMYAKAKMVITSRIHCALPCLGLETPVLFIKSKNDTPKSLCRFQGLESFFHVLNVFRDKPFMPEGFPKKIDENTTWENKLNYKSFKEQLVSKCKAFINEKDRTCNN